MIVASTCALSCRKRSSAVLAQRPTNNVECIMLSVRALCAGDRQGAERCGSCRICACDCAAGKAGDGEPEVMGLGHAGTGMV